jgi:hypothetical protein
MTKFKITAMIFILLIASSSFAQSKKTAADKTEKVSVESDAADNVTIDTDMTQPSAVDYMMGGVFGAVTIDGQNYQQIGLRPELKLWKFGIGLDISILLDEEGKIREEDWDEWDDYIDKIYYMSFGKKGETLYAKFGGLDNTTLGYGSIIRGYTNLLEYPTYKRQGVELGIDLKYAGMEFIMNDVKELRGDNRAFMGGGRIYVKPFSRLQIGGSLAGDLNEYKGLRDTDGDGYPDEVDMYPDNDKYATEIDYYAGKLGVGEDDAMIVALVNAGLISPIKSSELQDFSDERSKTGFWAVDAGLKIIDGDDTDLDIYGQYAKCLITDGWGFTGPGVRFTTGNFLEIYADYRQQSDEFIFGYYNDTYDLERAKYIDDGTGDLYVVTKKEQLKAAVASRGYLGGLKLTFFNLITGKAEYQDMRWKQDKDVRDKSLKGEVALKEFVFPLVTKAKAYYVQNNVEDIQWKTESTVMGGIFGLGVAQGVSVDFNYFITFEDKNGDGEIAGEDETITNVSISTSAMF